MKPKTKTFSRLRAAAKRVAIAKDILKQIAAEQYNIQTGTWLEIDPVEEVSSKQLDAETSARILQSVLLGRKQTVVVNTKPASCTCCAVGAACASAIRLFNQDTLKGSMDGGYDLGSYDDGVKILRKYFPVEQVDLMEAAFEIRTDSHHESASEASLEEAVHFGDRYDEAEARLQAICQNIIKNKGTFKP